MNNNFILVFIALFFNLNFGFAQNQNKFLDSLQNLQSSVSLEELEANLKPLAKHFDIGWSDSLEQQMLMAMATTAIKQYNFPAAQRFLDSLDLDFVASNQMEAFFWNNKAHVVFYTGSMDTAFVWYKKAEGLSQEQNQPEELCDAYNGLSMVYDRKGDFDSSIFYLDQLIQHANKNELRNEEAIGIFNLGSTYGRTGLHREAIKNFRKAVKKSTEYMRLQIIALNALGNAYISLDMNDSAAFFFQKALDNNKGQDLMNEAYSFGGMGTVLLSQNKPREAKESLNNAYTRFQMMGDPFYIAAFGLELGEAHMETGNFDSALLLTRQSQSYFEENEMWDELVKSTQQMYILMGYLGQIDSLEHYGNLSLVYRDSLSYLQTKQEIGEHVASVELKEKELQLAEERAENERNEKEMFIAFMSIGGLALILILLAYFTVNLKRLNGVLRLREEELQHSNQLLAELNTNNDQLLAIIAHDVRGPIASLKELLKFAAQEENVKDLIQLSQESAERTHKLLDELLNWARLDKGLDHFEKEEILLKPFIDHVFDMYRFQANSKQVKLINNCEEGVSVQADKRMFSTILRNLTANSIKFTNSDGWVSISHETRGGQHHIAVSDTGVGMSQHEIDELNRQSGQFKTGTKNEQGSGLGNKLVRMMVEKHKGSLEILSKVGKGTTVTVHLPTK